MTEQDRILGCWIYTSVVKALGPTRAQRVGVKEDV